MVDTTSIDYASGGDLLDRFARAWEALDGDLLVALFTEDAEYHVSPFEPPFVGHNAIRAHMLDVAAACEQIELTFERHWVSGAACLAAWHSSSVRRSDNERVRAAGFMTLDFQGVRCFRFRAWTVVRPAGDDG